ncbi:hypothetical protein E2562_038915 [Oryza meyeriana var. granulata]|uniref:Uncharacterized protein n=1 Tax=Oryza meyeriana var. granulata TaxID=110450 RepID=A0A6G1C310_9ORYZ|nr:hypothetical protein E2562_038915 [Oryza meyeriana var. granulata]
MMTRGHCLKLWSTTAPSPTELLEQPTKGSSVPRAPAKGLAVEYAAEGYGEAVPLLLMQETEFACSGFVVGVMWNDGVADSMGIAQFLQAVGDLTRGLPWLSVFWASCSHDSLLELPPLVAAIEKTMASLENKRFACLDITIPSTLIEI